jgi:hypothetical protein
MDFKDYLLRISILIVVEGLPNEMHAYWKSYKLRFIQCDIVSLVMNNINSCIYVFTSLQMPKLHTLYRFLVGTNWT